MEKKWYQTNKLQELIDWDIIMQLPRYAGGHDEQMMKLFKKSEVIAHWNEGDYQGMVATCIKLPSNEFAIYNDYYGSCSGCDSWEDASDESVKRMCIGLANSALIFKSIDDIKEFLSEIYKEEGNTEFYSWNGISNSGLNLLKEINRYESNIIKDKE